MDNFFQNLDPFRPHQQSDAEPSIISSTSDGQEIQAFFCPISYELMRDPVILVETGHTFEREAIQQWLQNNDLHPITQLPIRDKTLQPNYALKQTIESYMKHRASDRDHIRQLELEVEELQDERDRIEAETENRLRQEFEAMSLKRDSETNAGDGEQPEGEEDKEHGTAVDRFLSQMGLSEYCEAFRVGGFERLGDIMELKDEDFENTLGIAKKAHVLRIQRAIKELSKDAETRYRMTIFDENYEPDYVGLSLSRRQAVVHSGWLWKQSPSHHMWQHRWVVFDRVCMRWAYDQIPNFDPRRSDHVELCRNSMPVESTTRAYVIEGQPKQFNVVTPKRVYQWEADSEEECETWVDVINSFVEREFK